MRVSEIKIVHASSSSAPALPQIHEAPSRASQNKAGVCRARAARATRVERGETRAATTVPTGREGETAQQRDGRTDARARARSSASREICIRGDASDAAPTLRTPFASPRARHRSEHRTATKYLHAPGDATHTGLLPSPRSLTSSAHPHIIQKIHGEGNQCARFAHRPQNKEASPDNLRMRTPPPTSVAFRTSASLFVAVHASRRRRPY